MTASRIERLLAKYLSGNIQKSELDELNTWLESDDVDRTNLFRSFVRINYAMDTKMNQFNSERAREKLLQKIRDDKKKAQKVTGYAWMKYAAVFVLIAGLGYILLKDQRQTAEVAQPQPGQVTLRLSDGSFKTLEEVGESDITDKFGRNIGTKRGATLVYGKETVVSKIQLNTLTVPYGKRFELVFSDNSRAYLNAGTSITYPVQFIPGKAREVVLEGEAFFDVSRNEDDPFVVRANDLNIRVLGTEFVVTSYQEDESINTVLVEGSVGLYKSGENYLPDSAAMLGPGQLAVWGKATKDISIEQVDTDLYTSWMQGRIMFNHLRFKEILLKLERHYNVSITNTNNELAEQQFTASFDTETIEQVLEAFARSFPFTFSVKNDEITIN